MRRGCALALSALFCAGCGAPAPTPATPKPCCPTAAALWPVLEWSPALVSEAVGLLARTVLEGEWVRARRSSGAKPRILVAPISNRTSFFVERTVLQMPLEARLLESGAVTPVSEEIAKAKLDGVLQVTIRETLEIKPDERISGFSFAIEILQYRADPPPSWRRNVQIVRGLKAVARPSSCPEPTWVCPESGGHSLKTGCGVTWSCRNGRFSLACEPAVNGKARCRCESANQPAKSFELSDLCKAESVEAAAQQAANRECGWRLPAVR